MCGVLVDTSIVTIFLKKYFPELKGILSDEMLEPLLNNFIQQSILGLFTSSLNDDTCNLIWDFLFLEGNIILVKAFLAIFGVLKKQFLASKGDIEIVKNIIDKEILKIGPDSDTLLHSFLLKKFEFNEEYLEQARFKFSDIISTNLEDKNLENVQCKVKPNEEKINNQLTKNCCKKWPYCLYDGYFENVKTVMPYLILTHKNNLNLHNDYFFSETSGVKEIVRYSSTLSLSDETMYNIMLERRQHYCSEVLEEIKKERETVNTEATETNIDLRTRTQRLMSEMMKKENFQLATSQLMSNFKPEPFREIGQNNAETVPTKNKK